MLGESFARWRVQRVLLAATIAALLALPACNLLVEVPDARPLAVPAGVEPLTTGELLRFTFENLGEVSTGLLYRSQQPSRELLEFLAERCRLGYVLNLRGQIDPTTMEVLASVGGEQIPIRMSAGRDPTPRQILEVIRLTQRARAEGRSILMHCRAGADRTGVMVAIWRMLFQGITDRDALHCEMLLHRHVSFIFPNIARTVERFRPELFQPFIEDPSLIDDEKRVAELEARFFQSQPLASGRARTSSGPLRAGAAKSDLLEDWEGKVQMATYGPFPGRASGVREPVFARALVLDNGAVRLGIVSCDLLIMDASLREEVFRLAGDAGLALDDILLVATHTHTSVGAYVDQWAFELYMLGGFQPDMRKHLAGRITRALEEASASLRPARLGIGRTFVEGLSENRRIGTTVDTEVGIVKITAAAGEPLAVMVNFAAHPILEPQDGTISPDYPGLLARMLDERQGFGLFLQGAMGDVNARLEGAAEVWNAPGLAEGVARRLLNAVEYACARISTREEVELGSMTMLVDLPSVNVGLIPDLLAPLDWLAGGVLDWPEQGFVQALRIGDAALVATSSEITVRLGLEIKRRSPSPFPFVVTHAGAYSGYAMTQVNYAKKKLDPTSVVSLNGPLHGRVVVEAACDLMEAYWGDRLDPLAERLSPAAAARLEQERQHRGLSDEEYLLEQRAARLREEEEIQLHADPTLPQSRRTLGLVGDSLLEGPRLEVAYLYLEELRGGQRVEGRRREVRARLRLRGPWDLHVDGELAYLRSDWEGNVGPGQEEGATDLALGLEKPFVLLATKLGGTALRAIPRLELTAPTGNAEPLAPFAFALSSGVWRPAAGGALELTWETYRTVAVEGLYTTSLDRRHGRRPGDVFGGALSWRERHGAVSLLMELTALVRLSDSRRGGRLEVDVEETSFELGLRPGMTFHLGDRFELFAIGILPLAHGGSGAGAGQGLALGVTAEF